MGSEIPASPSKAQGRALLQLRHNAAAEKKGLQPMRQGASLVDKQTSPFCRRTKNPGRLVRAARVFLLVRFDYGL